MLNKFIELLANLLLGLLAILVPIFAVTVSISARAIEEGRRRLEQDIKKSPTLSRRIVRDAPVETTGMQKTHKRRARNKGARIPARSGQVGAPSRSPA